MIKGKPIYHSLIEKYKILFTLIPKNANTSIKWSLIDTFFNSQSNLVFKKLDNIDRFHAGTLGILNYIDNEQVSKLSNDYFKICVVRNPFDRLVAGWENKIKNLDRPRFGFKQACNFEQFIINICNTNDYDINRHFVPQHYFISYNNKLIDNYRILYFENLKEDWTKLQFEFSQKINVDLSNLPLLNKTKTKKINYEDYYTYKTKQLVEQKFKKDLEIFKYEF
jgi:chondroitin 4-sulfotransferase 11